MTNTSNELSTIKNELPNDELAKFIMSKLSNASKLNGYACTKDVAEIFNVNIRSVIRWRSQSKNSNRPFGPKCYFIANKYIYLLHDIYQYFIEHSIH